LREGLKGEKKEKSRGGSLEEGAWGGLGGEERRVLLLFGQRASLDNPNREKTKRSEYRGRRNEQKGEINLPWEGKNHSKKRWTHQIKKKGN